MSEWELEFSVLFLLGLWTCEMLKVSEKIFRSSLKRGLRNNRYPPDSPDAAFEPTVISRLAPISPILVRRFLVLGISHPSRADVANRIVAGNMRS
jgi:hypothetical protein